MVANVEIAMLKAFGFVVHVDHPHKIMLSLLLYLGYNDNQEFTQQAWNLANDSLRTPLCLLYKSEVIACGIIWLTSRWKQKISMPENPPWYSLLNVDINDIYYIAYTILDLFKREKAQYVSIRGQNKKDKRAQDKLLNGQIDDKSPVTIQSNRSPQQQSNQDVTQNELTGKQHSQINMENSNSKLNSVKPSVSVSPFEQELQRGEENEKRKRRQYDIDELNSEGEQQISRQEQDGDQQKERDSRSRSKHRHHRSRDKYAHDNAQGEFIHERDSKPQSRTNSKDNNNTVSRRKRRNEAYSESPEENSFKREKASRKEDGRSRDDGRSREDGRARADDQNGERNFREKEHKHKHRERYRSKDKYRSEEYILKEERRKEKRKHDRDDDTIRYDRDLHKKQNRYGDRDKYRDKLLDKPLGDRQRDYRSKY